MRQERIRRHREERPREWVTVEEPFNIEAAMENAPGDALVLIDCLSIWVANLLEHELPDDEVEARARAAGRAAAARSAGVIVVTNEVGSAVVPGNPLARRYRDVLGRTASAADKPQP